MNYFVQAFRKFDEMANKQTDKLRKLTKQVSVADMCV